MLIDMDFNKGSEGGALEWIPAEAYGTNSVSFGWYNVTANAYIIAGTTESVHKWCFRLDRTTQKIYGSFHTTAVDNVSLASVGLTAIISDGDLQLTHSSYNFEKCYIIPLAEGINDMRLLPNDQFILNTGISISAYVFKSSGGSYETDSKSAVAFSEHYDFTELDHLVITTSMSGSRTSSTRGTYSYSATLYIRDGNNADTDIYTQALSSGDNNINIASLVSGGTDLTNAMIYISAACSCGTSGGSSHESASAAVSVTQTITCA